MTVEACIDAFIETMDVIFEKQHTLPFNWTNGKIQARYDSKALQTRIKAIVRNSGFPEDAPMRGPKESACKV